MGNLCSPAWWVIHGILFPLRRNSYVDEIQILRWSHWFCCRSLVWFSSRRRRACTRWYIGMCRWSRGWLWSCCTDRILLYVSTWSFLLDSRQVKWSLKMWEANEWFKAAFIGTDMFLRLKAMINSSSTPALETSGKKNQWVISWSFYLSNRRVLSAKNSWQAGRWRGELCRSESLNLFLVSAACFRSSFFSDG